MRRLLLTGLLCIQLVVRAAIFPVGGIRNAQPRLAFVSPHPGQELQLDAEGAHMPVTLALRAWIPFDAAAALQAGGASGLFALVREVYRSTEAQPSAPALLSLEPRTGLLAGSVTMLVSEAGSYCFVAELLDVEQTHVLTTALLLFDVLPAGAPRVDEAVRDAVARDVALYLPSGGASGNDLTLRQLTPVSASRPSPLSIVSFGSLDAHYDGTKAFLLQHMRSVEGSEVQWTHIDVLHGSENEPDVAASLLYRAMVTERRGVGLPPLATVRFLPIAPRLQAEGLLEGDNFTAFVQAGAALAGASTWEDVPSPLRAVLADVAAALAGADAVWFVNQHHADVVFSHVARLVNPVALRLLDVTGKTHLPCSFGRASGAATLPGLPPLSRCVEESESIRTAAYPSEPAFNTRAYFNTPRERTYNYLAAPIPAADLQSAGLSAWAAVGNENPTHLLFSRAALLEAARNSGRPSLLRYAGTHLPEWVVAPYDAVVAPSHATAQSSLVRGYGLPVLVLPGVTAPDERNASTSSLIEGGAGYLPTPASVVPSVATESTCAALFQEAGWGAYGLGPIPANAAEAAAGVRPPAVVAFVGRLSREKGASLFLKAARRVRDTLAAAGAGAARPSAAQYGGVAASKAAEADTEAMGSDASVTGWRNASALASPVHFLVIGSSGTPGESGFLYRQALGEAAVRVGLRPGLDTHFLGFVHPTLLSRLYASACIDTLVTPYLRGSSETFGLVLTEAMSAGVPVVHYAVGGTQDYSLPGVNTVLPSKYDSDALAEAMASVLAGSPWARLAVGRAAAASLANGAAEGRDGDVPAVGTTHARNTAVLQQGLSWLLAGHRAAGGTKMTLTDAWHGKVDGCPLCALAVSVAAAAPGLTVTVTVRGTDAVSHPALVATLQASAAVCLFRVRGPDVPVCVFLWEGQLSSTSGGAGVVGTWVLPRGLAGTSSPRLPASTAVLVNGRLPLSLLSPPVAIASP